ncbi:succinyl-diaminopimelate desuccinylase [Comamonadaceae bacterium PP-2]
MTATLALAQDLIARPSVTPQDMGCQDMLAQRLQALGFVCETLESGPDDFRVTNLWARLDGSLGEQARTFVFAGHTDVVPTGPVEQWGSHPFKPTVRDDRLYGRGASDMKTSIAAFVVAVEELLAEGVLPRHNIALLITSDEEGPGRDGTVIVCQALKARGEPLEWCVVGEPTATQRTGDTIKNGRRGTMSGRLTVKGVQGHIAYPHLARNPIHLLAPALAELVAIRWDEGNDFFPPTSWQVSNIHAGTGATNVIPGEVVVDFNFRFCTESTPESLQQRVHETLHRHQLDFDLQWTLGGLPFLTPRGALVDALEKAIADETGLVTELSTSGGTSDGRFIAQVCPQVVEFGPPNATIHKIDEHIALADIEPLKNVYRRLVGALTL